MFCRYCAAPLPEDATACPQCGREQFPSDQQRPADIPLSEQSPYAPPTAPSSTEVIWHAGYHKKVYAKLCRRIALSAILSAAVAVFLTLIFTLDSLKFLGESTWLVVIYAALLLELVIGLILRCIQLRVVKRTELTVTQCGVTGVGGNARYIASVPFELTFSQVKKVGSLPKHLMIDTQTKKIFCLIENSDQAEQVIDNRLRRMRNDA